MSNVRRSTWASVRAHRNYRLYFCGQVVSQFGSWMQNVALAWYIVELTSSPVAVGLFAVCRFAPFTFFALFAGVLTDRVDNRLLIMSTQALSMAASIVLAFLALAGNTAVLPVYALALVGGLALAVEAPARHAFTFQLVGREELPNAVALNVALFNMSQVTGPAVAGFVIAMWGVGACFAINAASFVVMLGAIAMIRPAELYKPARAQTITWWRGVREGLSYARHNSDAGRLLLMTTALTVVGFNVHVIMPLLAEHTLHGGPKTLGFLGACFGGGALVGALSTARYARASWVALGAATAGFSASMFLLAPLEWTVACGAVLVVSGLCYATWWSQTNTILQLDAPEQLRGRVVSLSLWAYAGLAPLGGLITALLVERGGTLLALTVSGVVGLGMTAAVLDRLRRARLAPVPKAGLNKA